MSVPELAGEIIEKILIPATGNGHLIERIKVVTKNGWFAARASALKTSDSGIDSSHVLRFEVIHHEQPEIYEPSVGDH